jgi:ribonucleotide reductase alpha subunit
MKRVELNTDWSLFDSNECIGLDDVYGDEYYELYLKYENEGKAKKSVSARKIWNYILTSQIETGTPYILFKDNVNKKSNQMNIGTITNSNLCVVGKTKILTDSGYIQIKDLVNQEVNIWNGNVYSKSLVMKTGENQKIIKVILNDGAELECTEYHKFYIEENGKIITIQAKDLVKGMNLEKYNLPINSYETESTNRIDKMNLINNFENNMIKSENKEYLYNSKLLLQELGYHSILRDGELEIITELNSNNNISVCIYDIIDENKFEDTYCFNEPLKHAGIFNGVYAGNCAEIVEYSSDKEYAVCTLASISLPNFVSDDGATFDFEKLIEVAGVVIKNLNKIIDVNYYPVPETELSNKKHRPLGLGVQGLSDVYAKMQYPFDSNEAKELNKQIFETLYYGALVASHQIAKETQRYSTFEGSPISQGKFQFDLWNVKPSDKYDWDELRENIKKDGIANSLLIALMPTASTSQILGNNECFEPITSNMYTRRTMAGDFIVINKYLVKDLMKHGLWNIEMKNKIIANSGSVQGIITIPKYIQDLYKTVWEIKQKVIIDQSIDRGPFICQTQSMNLFFEEPTQTTLTSALFHGWKNGLKTGSYYIRTKPKAQAQQFTIDPSKNKQKDENNDGPCEMCSA